MAEPTLSDVVSVAARFRRSASIEADYGRVELLADYIVSPLAVEVTSRMLRELTSPGGNRAWTMVGPYGSGKSSFLTFLASCLSDDALRNAAFHALSRMSRAAMSEVANARARLGPKHLIPVVITGSRRPLGPAVLKAVLAAAARIWPKETSAPSVDDIRAVLSDPSRSADTNQVTDCVVGFAEEVTRRVHRAAGVIVLIDEMGKFLEYAAQNPAESDVYLLQQLAEAAARTPGPGLSILTVLHQDFEMYAGNLTASGQAEWTKVRGRYETLTFQESAGHLLKLMAHAIDRRTGAAQVAMFRPVEVTARAEAANNLAKGSTPERTRNLEACFPLNPITALCLGPLFRLQLGQNERSLFSFLSSSEPGGFQSYLKITEGKSEDRPYCLDHLYAYVMNNTSARAGGAGRARIWAATEEALHRLPKDAVALDERILKALAILTATREGAGLDGSKAAIAEGLNEDPIRVEKRLDRLRESSILVYRKYKQSYQVWDGSDIDVDDLIIKAGDPVRRSGGIADHIQRLLPAFPVVASRHYHKKGTLRYLDAQYVGPDQIGSREPSHGDGSLLYVIPDKDEQLADAETRARGVGRKKRGWPVVVALPGEVSTLLETTIELLSVQHVLDNTPDLDGDPVARRELDERRTLALERLAGALARAFGNEPGRDGARWFFEGEPLKVYGRPSAAASAIFDKVYCDAPLIFNELVNRQEVSSAAAAARHTLMKRMLTTADQPQLGIEGHPPELSLYRSVLEATGLHREIDGRWTLGEPRDTGLQKVFSRIKAQLDGQKGNRPRSFAELSEDLRQPPFGVRPGVSLILLFAWYLLHEDMVFLYEDGGLVPVVGDDLVHRLLRAPEQVELQMPTGNKGADEAVRLLMDRLQVRTGKGKGEGLFDVVRAIIQIIRKLPPYTTQAAALGKEAKQVRVAVTSAKDPVRLIWTDLPMCLGFQSFDQPMMSGPGKAEEFTTALVGALGELQGAERALLRRIERTLRDLLRFDEKGEDFYAMVLARARLLADFKDASVPVQRWLDISMGLDPDSPESRDMWLVGIATAVVGKAPRAWMDADIPRFAQGAMELCRAYLGAEELAVERQKVQKGSFRMIRVSVLDADGKDRSGVAMLRQEDAEKVQKFMADIRSLAVKHEILGRELAYAVIADMMEEFERSKQEDSSDV